MFFSYLLRDEAHYRTRQKVIALLFFALSSIREQAGGHLLGNFFSGVYDLDKSIRSIRIYWFLIQWPREVSDMFMTPTQPLSTTGREYAKEIKEAWQEAFQ